MVQASEARGCVFELSKFFMVVSSSIFLVGLSEAIFGMIVNLVDRDTIAFNSRNVDRKECEPKD